MLVLCSSYSCSSDSVNELKRIKTRGQTFIQPSCVDGALVNRLTPPAGAGGEEAFNQIKASHIHKPQVGAIHDHQQSIVPLLWALCGRIDQETTTTTRQRSTFIIIMVNVVFPVVQEEQQPRRGLLHVVTVKYPKQINWSRCENRLPS